MTGRTRQSVTGCPAMMGRRGFLTSLGASALAAKIGLFDFASELFAADAKPPAKPLVRAVFLRPDQDRYWLGWPGACYDVKGMQAVYTKTMADAAKELGVHIDIEQKPITSQAEVNAFLEGLKKSPPDGLIVTIQHMGHWRNVNHLVANKGDLPTIVFSPMGTSFTGHLQPTRTSAKTFVGATQEVAWLAQAVRMLHTVWQMKRSRICVITGKAAADRPLDVIGTTLHYIPRDTWPNVLKKTETSDEVKAIAAYYKKEAKKIVEPNEQDILNAAKTYVVARKIMADTGCNGITMDCLGLVGQRLIPCPPCMAWSRLLDENIVGACEADWNAAISLLLTGHLFGRPGFMQDPAPNSVNNTLMGAHCTCATKLNGFDKPHEPFILRSHSESEIGVSPQVLWKIGQKVTIMKFQGPGSIILGTGKVVGNIDTPPSGGCRTSVDLALDDVPDARDAKGFHQLFIYGDLENQFKAYCQLAGIKVVHL